MYLIDFILTNVLSMTWTKYETGFPVHDTARPLGLSSETRSIVPMSKMTNRKVFKTACENILKEIKHDRNNHAKLILCENGCIRMKLRFD